MLQLLFLFVIHMKIRPMIVRMMIVMVTWLDRSNDEVMISKANEKMMKPIKFLRSSFDTRRPPVLHRNLTRRHVRNLFLSRGWEYRARILRTSVASFALATCSFIRTPRP